MKMVDTGLHWLAEAGKANEINQYYLLAAISANYCIARDFDSIDWKNILILYDHLELLDHSPLVTLNKSIAVSKVYGQQKALELLKTIENNPLIESYHLFYSTRAEFFQQLGFAESALDSLRMAMKMCSLATEKKFLQGKIDRCLAAIRGS
jgi:RNA polymerase sigma-70 factor (ECF subfamily)